MFYKSRISKTFTLLASFLVLGNSLVFGAGWKTLHGHVPSVTRRLIAIGQLAATNQLHLAIGVPLHDAAGLENFLAQVYDPASPNFHKYLTPEEFTARFGPTEEDYTAVKNFALTNGLTIAATHGNRLLLDVTGSAAAVEKAFHISLRIYRHPTESRDFFAPDTEPTVDAALPMVDVSGLENYSRPYPKIIRANASAALKKTALPKDGSGPVFYGFSTYIGQDFRNAYAAGTTLDGTGQTVGLLQFDGYYENDITNYENLLPGAPQVLLQPIFLDSFSGTPTTGADSGNIEVSLDIEMAISMAPGLSKIVVFEGNPASGFFIPNDVLNNMAASNTIKNLSCSWGWTGGPSATTENIFLQMAAQGQSFFNASGDSDAFTPGQVDNSNFAGSPSSSPHITQVSGTYLNMNGIGASYASESVWNRGGGIGGSGGISSYYAIPTWQQGINSFLVNGGSTTQRNIPDVAMTAENVYVIYGNGGSASVGGTSCAAPLWAGFMALVNQQAAAVGKSSVGFINPAIYEIANESIYNSTFNDVTSGDNTSPTSPNAFYAVPGYDLCTGIGTPAGTNLINALLNPDPLIVISNYGFNAIGSSAGTFNITTQIFYLTNAGTATLGWSLINTSAWLNVSTSGGSLANGTITPVIVGLNTVASNLTAGSYTANLWFSNVTSSVAHSRFFTLKVNDALGILPTNNFAFSGAAGGSFGPASQTITLTNAGNSNLGWSLNNTSVWFNVSPTAGTISSSAQSNITFTLASTVTNLPNGIYNATFQITNLASQFVQAITGAVLVGQPLVQNGGFETGDFTGWTLNDSGDGSDFVDNGTYITPHSGSYVADLGEASAFGFLSQTLLTVPGQSYLVSFWLDNPVAGYSHPFGGTELFKANWNTNASSTNTIYSISNPSAFSWKNLSFVVTATRPSTVLQFAARNDPDFFGLDDVTVTPGFAPSILMQSTNQIIFSGGNATFNASVSGSTNLSYQWRKNGTNISNGGNISGATTNVLTLTPVTTNNTGNYTLIVTNRFGSSTSSVATLTVVVPPLITGSFTNQTMECGGNVTYTINPFGTPPLNYQWSLDGSLISGATSNSLLLTNVHLPNHTVTLVVTNLYGTVTSNATLIVQDTTAPVITLNGSNPMTIELGSLFTDPGATASDACAGLLSVFTSGIVNPNAVGTNTLTYEANDGNGNTNITVRNVIVRDTTPPAISWSFTNLTLVASTNCSAQIPDLTGTNFILATDLSNPLVVSQAPTNGSYLLVGTNIVILAVADAYSNTAYSTNQIIVQDQTPPVIFIDPQSQTNILGATTIFNVAATACTPLSFQWFFGNAALTTKTNNALKLSNLTLAEAGNYFVIAHAAGGTSTSTVVTLTVNLIAPSIDSVAASLNGGFTMNLVGSPGYTYILEATPDLFSSVNWQPIATNTLNTNGVWQFTDTSATNFLHQFYRLKLAQ